MWMDSGRVLQRALGCATPGKLQVTAVPCSRPPLAACRADSCRAGKCRIPMEPGLAAQLLAYFTHWPERQTACGGCGAAPLTQQTRALTWQRATGPGRPPEAGGCRVQPWSCSGRGTEVWAQPLLGGAGATLTDPPALLSSCSLRTPSIRPPRWPHQTLDAGQMRPGGGLTVPPPARPGLRGGALRARPGAGRHTHTCTRAHSHSPGQGKRTGRGCQGEVGWMRG